jgi:hypothetical protein
VDSITEVRYGGVVVGRSPQLRDRTDSGAFLVFSEPLPVGTPLVLKIDDKEQNARVTEVVESADASAAGMRVRFVSAAERAAPALAPKPAAAPPAPAAAQPVAEAGSAPVPVPVGGEGSAGSTGVPSSGEASAQHATDSQGGHHDGEHGRRKRRRK